MGDGIRVYMMYDLSLELTVILTTIWYIVAKVQEGWVVSKQAAQKFDTGRFNVMKVDELEVGCV
jgi:hypothetical protein